MKIANLYRSLMLRTLAVILTGLLTSQYMVAQDWFNNNWSYRRTITVPNPGATALTDFQVKITLNSSTPFDFTKAKSDGSDIRVASVDGTTLIPFWIESWDDVLQQATVWVKVPTIPTSGTTVLLYYGNNAATSVSNGASTFSFFDDFESWAEESSTGWADITSTPDPAKADNTAAVFNGKLYVFGGYGANSSVYLDEVFEYDPGTNAWTTKTPMPTARWGMVAVEFNGLIYVFAGQGTANNKNEVYNPANDTWDVSKAVVPANLAQQGLMGVKYGDKIHLFYQSYHYEYDPNTDLYTQKANVPRRLTWSTCATIGSKIYIIGGYSYDAPTDACDVNYEYDPATDTWATKAPMPVSRYGATRENPVINGKIYVTHGHAGTPFFVTNYVYDPSTDTWEQKGSAAHARDGVSCGVINNKLYVVGGRDVPSAPYGVAWAEVYDPVADTGVPLSGPELWTTSGTSYVYADGSAKYKGNYGLVIRQTTDAGTQRYAQSVSGFGSVYALDFDWQVTDIGGYSYIVNGNIKPQGLVTLSEGTQAPLFFYNFAGTPSVRWYAGSFNTLATSTYNNWHKITVVRNGSSSRVAFDGTTYQPLTAPSGGTGKIQFGVYYATTQYIDNVRVRQWAGSDPVAATGTEESLNTQWTGSLSSDWGTAGNWTSGVPADWSIVTIQGGANFPVLNGSMTIGSTASLTLDPGGALTVNGDLNNSGMLTIGSTLTSSGSLIVNGASTGNITYNRQLKPGSDATRDWHLVSAPVENNTETNATKISAVYQWSEVTGAWTTTSITSSLPGHGYNLRQTAGSNGLISFTGTLVNGDILFAASSPYADAVGPEDNYFTRAYVTGRSLENPGGGGWNLLGNPFSSSMLGSGFIDANYSPTPSLSQFDPNYVALYLFDGTQRRYFYIAKSTGWPGGDELSATHIQAGQGFFVLAMNDNSEFLFTRAMQEHSTGTDMLKSAGIADRWPGLQLKVKYGTDESITTIVYNEKMTAGVDPGYDVGLFKSGQELEVYTTLALKDNSVNFARQALPVSGTDTIILPVGIDSEEGGEVTFSADVEALGNYKFWLEDRTAGTFTNLNSNTYTVTIPSKTYGTGRFFLKAANTITGLDGPMADDNGSGLRIWTGSGKVIIKGDVSEKAFCEIYDLSGKRVLESRLEDGGLNTIDIQVGMHGVFLVKVTDGVKVMTRKVAIL